MTTARGASLGVGPAASVTAGVTAGATAGVAVGGSAEFAHARLRARWGLRPDETQWHHIEITRELAPLLDLARAGALARWVRGIDADSGLHAIERALRQRWRDAVEEVAAWLDAPWMAAAHWCAALPLLGAVQQWARGDAMARWALDEPGLPAPLGEGQATPGDDRHLAAMPPRLRGPWARVLRAARADPAGVLDRWHEAWLDLMPAGRAKAAIARALSPLLRTHVALFASAATVDGWAARRALTAQLAALMRRHPAEPIEAFVFLALQGLELERLRAEVVARAAFPKRTLRA
ncbi:MAG: hypothetical protein JNL30_18005 [Rubrivivax sp.]|nr:hypothetical protein [Rubrivivax sp.]